MEVKLFLSSAMDIVDRDFVRPIMMLESFPSAPVR